MFIRGKQYIVGRHMGWLRERVALLLLCPCFCLPSIPLPFLSLLFGYWSLLHGLEGTFCTSGKSWISLVAQMVKCLPTMWETQVRSLHWEDPLEKEMASHSSTLAWKIPWREEPGRLRSTGSQRVRYDWVTALLHIRGLCLPLFEVQKPG